MKSVKLLGWVLYVLIIIMVTYTLSSAAPPPAPVKQLTGKQINLQKDLNKTLYVPIYVITHKDAMSVKVKTVRRIWSSFDGSDYQPFKVGEKIRLVKQVE